VDTWRLANENRPLAIYQDAWQRFQYPNNFNVAFEGSLFTELGAGTVLLAVGTETLRYTYLRTVPPNSQALNRLLQDTVTALGYAAVDRLEPNLARVVAQVRVWNARERLGGYAYLVELAPDTYTIVVSTSAIRPQEVARRDVAVERVIATLDYRPPQDWNASPAYSSREGRISHDVAQAEPNRQIAAVNLADFVMETRFSVPYAIGAWDVGVYFRSTAEHEYLFVLDHEGKWELKLTRRQNGRVTTTNLQTGQTRGRGIISGDLEFAPNRLHLQVSGTAGTVYLNGGEIAQLDLTTELGAGAVALMSGSSEAREVPNASLLYQDFTVYAIDTPVVVVPTVTPSFVIPTTPITTNADWTPLIETFDGVEMVLVPPGCFMMGNADGFDTERPAHEQCFEQAFWLDRFEVTNAQVGSIGVHDGALRPRDSLQWAEARDFCLSRGARLPTEREWEYAARGPANWLYPWGNEFKADRVYYAGNSNGETVEVGSFPQGASWVGAQDLAGNVWEWVSSEYGDYPYRAEYEDDDDERAPRILRGGPDVVRVTLRIRYNPLGGGYGIGFRCARDVDTP
jgi:formylglycine-generating enzyme required for sulfatase activity